jgi:hypothetical protein
VTTYLAIAEPVGTMECPWVAPFCSPACRAAAGCIPSSGFVAHDFLRYEFDEECWRCGATIPATPRSLTTTEMVDRLAELYAVGEKFVGDTNGRFA